MGWPRPDQDGHVSADDVIGLGVAYRPHQAVVGDLE
jgi:hypothetical protein